MQDDSESVVGRGCDMRPTTMRHQTAQKAYRMSSYRELCWPAEPCPIERTARCRPIFSAWRISGKHLATQRLDSEMVEAKLL